MTKRDTLKLIDKAMSRNKAYIAGCDGNENPQITVMMHKAMGKLAAFEAVRFAMDGSLPCLLKTDAQGLISGVNATV